MSTWGDILGKLSGGANEQAVRSIAPAFLYMYIPFPNKAWGQVTDYLSQAPAVVRQKFNYAHQAQDYLVDHWGFRYNDLGNAQGTGILQDQLRKNLGMDAQDYLGLVFGYKSLPVRIYGIFDFLGGAASAAAGSSPVGVAISTGSGLLSSFIQNVVKYNPPDTVKMAFPDVSDWAGFPSKVQIGKYVPSINDPLGITGYDGVTMGAAPLVQKATSNIMEAGVASGGKTATVLLALAFIGGGLYWALDSRKRWK